MKPWFRPYLGFLVLVAALGLAVDQVLARRRVLEVPRFRAFAGNAEAAEIREVAERVDNAFDAAWKAAGLECSPPAPPLTVYRRVSLALTGTIPSLAEIRALESHSAGEDTLSLWVSYLLADRRSSDYLAERFARAMVGVEDGPFILYRRHRLVSWLSDQIHRNRSYGEWARDLIASSGIWTTRPEVNFVTVTVDPNNEQEGPDEVRLAARVSRAFLGVRIDCVQCHDDKFSDRWKQTHFHELASFFARAEMSITGVRDNPEKKYEYRYLGRSEKEPVLPQVPFQENLLPADGALRDRLARWVTHPENRPFARTLVNRAWALLFQRPLHEPLESIPLDGPFPPGMEILADDLIAHDFDLHRLLRVIASTRVFRLDSTLPAGRREIQAEAVRTFAAFPLTRLRPEQVAGSLLQSASLKTVDANAHVLSRVIRHFQQRDFVRHYGDAGSDEFEVVPGTIPQRLVLMNGSLVKERTKDDLVMNAATRIAALAPAPSAAVEAAYLAVLTRRPSPEESRHFVDRLENDAKVSRAHHLEDLYWTLINSTEFAWNH
ncbi:MAG: DUF1549 domain-containing protein [Verrucomicrobiales bacterium]|nr:DUF1549 domain-containing protein [Verrucomicrobiales bacterium]